MVVLRKILLFYLGGCAYMLLELLWRGWTHGSMFLAGGAAFVLIGHLNHVNPRLPLPLRAVAGALIVTMVELAVGLAVNREYAVWDYRGQPMNFMGQVCLPFTVLWVPVSLLALGLHGLLEERIRERTCRRQIIIP